LLGGNAAPASDLAIEHRFAALVETWNLLRYSGERDETRAGNVANLPLVRFADVDYVEILALLKPEREL
jgi:hypothetical protein